MHVSSSFQFLSFLSSILYFGKVFVFLFGYIGVREITTQWRRVRNLMEHLKEIMPIRITEHSWVRCERSVQLATNDLLKTIKETFWNLRYIATLPCIIRWTFGTRNERIVAVSQAEDCTTIRFDPLRRSAVSVICGPGLAVRTAARVETALHGTHSSHPHGLMKSIPFVLQWRQVEICNIKWDTDI